MTLIVLLALCAGCEQLIGLKDRTFGDAGAAPSSSMCEDYCKNSLQYCTTDSKLDGYTVMDDCLAVCKSLPPGKPNDQTGNSVACRAYHASKAGGIESRASECPAASPGGGSPDSDGAKCGSNCEGYCSVYTKVCPDSDVMPEDCMRECEALPDRGSYDALNDFGMPADTIQCRLAHLTAAAEAKQMNDETERKIHCGLPPNWGHAAIRPPLNGTDPFCDVVPFTRQCKDFCKLTISTCGTSFPVYDDEAQCEALCAGYDVGDSSGDSSNDTLACRRWHAYVALTLGPAREHCSHAGPIGDGHCGGDGDKCVPFCNLYKRTCGDQFKSDYNGNLDNCKADCQKLKGSSPTADDTAGYNLLNQEEIEANTLQCRTHQVALAAAAAADKKDTKMMCMLASPKIGTCLGKN
jgi:hypothetical protein